MSNYTEQVTAFTYDVREHAALGRVGVITAEAQGLKPPTLGPASVDNLVAALARAIEAATAGDIQAIAITGTGSVFLAGADLSMFTSDDAQLRAPSRSAGARTSSAGARATSPGTSLTPLLTPEEDSPTGAIIREMTKKMHGLHVLVRTLDVPILAHLNGAAFGGGVEVALLGSVRTAHPEVRAIALPETSLGILPGWGGTTLLPALIDPELALQIIIDEPAKDRVMDARAAHERGLLDGVAETLDDALDLLAENRRTHARTWTTSDDASADHSSADTSSAGDSAADDSNADRPGEGGQSPRAALLVDADSDRAHAIAEAVTTRQKSAERRDAQGAPAAKRALQLIAQLPGSTLEDALAREGAALVELAESEAAEGSLYAAELLRRGKPGREPVEGAKPLTKVGVAGAGLMASQIAAQLARGLRVPVIMRDLDDAIAQKGLENARAILTDAGDAEAADLLSATTDLQDLAGADLVLEAVPEVMHIKQTVFAELESVLEPSAVLATNTSSLSVTEMSSQLQHSERVVGLHFFNPVAKMPLVEIIHTEQTDAATLATGNEVVRRLRKFGVESADAPGFIVNRLLFRMLGTVLGAMDAGAPAAEVDASLDALGLPMRPLTLLDMVGLAVADHVGRVMVEQEGPERFHASAGLHAMAEKGERFTEAGAKPPAPVRAEVDGIVADANASSTGATTGADAQSPQLVARTGEDLRRAVEEGLADEITRMVEEGVVKRREDIDLALILGAGFPRHRGGITTYLRQQGLLD